MVWLCIRNYWLYKLRLRIPGKQYPGVLADLGIERVDQWPAFWFDVDSGKMGLGEYVPNDAGRFRANRTGESCSRSWNQPWLGRFFPGSKTALTVLLSTNLVSGVRFQVSGR